VATDAELESAFTVLGRGCPPSLVVRILP